jgi:hypothetical protein
MMLKWFMIKLLKLLLRRLIMRLNRLLDVRV